MVLQPNGKFSNFVKLTALLLFFTMSFVKIQSFPTGEVETQIELPNDRFLQRVHRTNPELPDAGEKGAIAGRNYDDASMHASYLG